MRIVIITGGGQGIGFGIAQCFAELHDTVVIADIRLNVAKEAAAKLMAHGAAETLGVACDVGSPYSVQAMVDQVWARFGRIDVLVNNAGICPFVDVMEITPELWQKTIDVDLNGPFHCTQRVVRKMISAGIKGSIIFITSLADTRVGHNQVDYGAAKSGLRLVMIGFANALGRHGINCNAVAPGHVSTPLTAHWWESPEGKAAIPKTIPIGRLSTPVDIGYACTYLASPQAACVHGITLRVDGGIENGVI